MGGIVSGAMSSFGGLLGGGAALASGATNTGLANTAPQQAALAANAAAAQQGVQSNIGNQNAFAQALQTQMQGGGPNLAGAQLASATGQNVANQAALMASQRGTGSNAGLIARQAAQQGAATQQNTAGQAAQLRAQQQLAAQGALGNVYGQVGQEQGQNLATTQQALSAQNQNILGTNQINANIGMANTQNKLAAISGIGQGLSGSSSSSGGGGGGGGGGGLDALAAMADGGEVKRFDDGGSVDSDINNSMFQDSSPNTNIPTQSNMGMVASNRDFGNTDVSPVSETAASKSQPNSKSSQPPKNMFAQGPNQYAVKEDSGTANIDSQNIQNPTFSTQLPDHLQAVANIYHPQMSGSQSLAKGGSVKKVDALVSPGEKILKPKDITAVKHGKNPMSVGGKVPGKPVVPGDKNDYANDTVPAKLTVGSIVLPRSVTQSKNPGKDADAFVMAIINKKKGKKS